MPKIALVSFLSITGVSSSLNYTALLTGRAKKDLFALIYDSALNSVDNPNRCLCLSRAQVRHAEAQDPAVYHPAPAGGARRHPRGGLQAGGGRHPQTQGGLSLPLRPQEEPAEDGHARLAHQRQCKTK